MAHRCSARRSSRQFRKGFVDRSCLLASHCMSTCCRIQRQRDPLLIRTNISCRFSAQMPSDFDIRVVPWRSSDRKTAVSSTHDRLITITRRYTGVPFPSESVLTGWSEQAPSNLVGVTFDLIVEPLSFGIVPYTAWPTIFSVVMMAFLGYLFATRFVLPRLLDPLLTRADAKTE